MALRFGLLSLVVVAVVCALFAAEPFVASVDAAAALQITDNTSPLTFGINSDTNLYRSPAGGPSLRTDSSLIINGAVRAANLITAGTTVTVCPAGGGCQFTSLAAAVNFVRPLFLSAPLTIQVGAGTYPEPNISFGTFGVGVPPVAVMVAVTGSLGRC